MCERGQGLQAAGRAGWPVGGQSAAPPTPRRIGLPPCASGSGGGPLTAFRGARLRRAPPRPLVSPPGEALKPL
jgi:hypothetical protein